MTFRCALRASSPKHATPRAGPPYVPIAVQSLAPSPKAAAARITQPLAIHRHWYVSIAGRVVVFTAAIFLANTTSANPTTSDPTPLLTYAASHHFPPAYAPSAQYAMNKRLRQITFDLSKDPPPETNCAQTLGAKRFATLFDDLGSVYSSLGDDAKAAEAYAKAIACTPRAEFLHAQLAAALLDMGRYKDARVETQRQLSLGRANFSVYTLITQLDLIEDRWLEAVTDARLAATEAPDDEQAIYWQCFLWIAQKRVGTQTPVLVNRRIPETWPTPILESLQGKLTEAELVDAVTSERDEHRQREILTEALFYTGEKQLAEKHVDEAAKYFTATTRLDVPYFIEHHLAVAELEKLRHHEAMVSTPDAEPAPSDQKL
jgi:lipoprotein NlpI